MFISGTLASPIVNNLWAVSVERGMLDLSGKIAIVTGAAHGFGRAISLTLGRSGAAIWAVDLLADELAETVELAHAQQRPAT
jgi:NADP-dependent 3-hydroxy acid dehydrogenase YdfG